MHEEKSISSAQMESAGTIDEDDYTSELEPQGAASLVVASQPEATLDPGSIVEPLPSVQADNRHHFELPFQFLLDDNDDEWQHVVPFSQMATYEKKWNHFREQFVREGEKIKLV